MIIILYLHVFLYEKNLEITMFSDIFILNLQQQ